MAKSTVFIAPDKPEIVMERVFNAPRPLVFRAYTDPQLIAKWWGPRNTTTIVDKMEARTGGSWRFIQRGEGGEEYAFYGEYREVTPVERIVSTFVFEPMPDHVAIDDARFEDLGDKTKVTVRSIFENMADRDGMVQSGMESGANESWDRLEELLEAEKAAGA